MTPEQAAALRKPFDANQIGKLPKAGLMLDYVGHAATTDRLLQVDPEWTWQPFTAEEILALPPSLRDAGLWIHLTVAGVTRPGVGDGKSAKECIGDAIRNAAMRFGVALDLWAKEDLSADRDVPPAEPAETDVEWATDWMRRVADADSDGILRGLWGELVGQVKAGNVHPDEIEGMQNFITARKAEIAA
jgi:hypothetical protein